MKSKKGAVHLLLLVVLLIGGYYIYTHGRTASIVNNEDTLNSQVLDLDCRFATYSEVSANDNLTFRTDPTSNKHLYVDVKHDSEGSSFNGTLSCDRSGNIDKGNSAECYAIADNFRSEVSTTDSSNYLIVDQSTQKSLVSGISWQQKIYLNDGSVATSSSTAEKIRFAYSQDEANEDLGFYLTLASTGFNSLNNQTSKDVRLICGSKEVGKITITKTAS